MALTQERFERLISRSTDIVVATDAPLLPHQLKAVARRAGLGLALACDLRIMSSNAILTTAFAKVGFSGDYGGTFFLSKLVGKVGHRQAKVQKLDMAVVVDEKVARFQVTVHQFLLVSVL